jgi:hypothetical protein
MSDLLNKASLVVIPSGYKEDTVYSVVPSDGSGDLSFTRASNGTRINSAGLVEVCPWNLYTYSEVFSNSIWANGNATITDNTTTAPNGTLTADSMFEQVVNDYQIKGQNYSMVSGQTFTFSIYVKANTRNFFRILVGNGVLGGDKYAYFDLVNLTTTSTSLITPSIESVGNGWCKIVISFTCNQTGTDAIYFGSSPNMTSGYLPFVGDASKGVYIWGAQLNIGSTAKPYFPTTDRLNVPRLTYQNGGGGCPSLLLEKQSTNYFPYSQNISLWYAPADGVTLTSNTTDTVSPDGTYNASKITIVGGSKRSYEITNSVAGVGTFSAYVKAGTSNTIVLYTSSASVLIGYNLSTLAVTQTTGTGTITSVGNGWYRITATNTLGASEVLQVLYTGNANETIYIWGFQVEASSYVTSYIFTNGASATRVADVAQKTGISSLIGQTEGVIFVDFVFNGYMESVEEMSLSVNSSNRIGMYTFDGTNTLRGYIVASGAVPFENNFVALTLGQRYKVAFAYKSGDCVVYINGVNVFANSSTFSFGATIDAFKFSSSSNTQPFYKPINQTTLFKTRLTNAELASLTTI